MTDFQNVNRVHIGGVLKEIATIIPEHRTFITIEVSGTINERTDGGRLIRYPYTFPVMVWLDERLAEELSRSASVSPKITVSGKLNTDSTVTASYINPFTDYSSEPF